MRSNNAEENPLEASPAADSLSLKKEPTPIQYCVVTAVRDEEPFIGKTIESLLGQTIRPTEWIILDDGSRDATAAIVSEYAKRHSFIRFMQRKDRGYRSKGGGVEAFLEAIPQLQSKSWNYLVNLDGDITFGPDYFERCFEQFQKTPSLGIGGGTVYAQSGKGWQKEHAPAFHVRGAAKIYRRECWEAIGGLWRGLGWDTVDEIKANQLGWKTQSFPGLELFHHRLSGSIWGSWGFAVVDGEADYIVGYHPLFFCAKCIRHIFYAPLLIRSFGMAFGYLRCICRRTPKVEDREMEIYLRRQQLRRILGMSSIWR